MLPYTEIIHEKLSIILTFAYSWAHLHDVLNSRFTGEQKYLRKTVDGIAPENAIRAFIELASYLRLLDNKENMSGYLEQVQAHKLGRVMKQAHSEEPLYLRDLTNKIMHAQEWKWDVSAPNEPKLICVSNDPKRWLAAEIDIQAFTAFCGQLMH
jgi:hypothetical protein